MSTIHRFNGSSDHFDWENVEAREYAGEAVKGATGKILIGKNEGAEHFVFRYFCIEPGGHSTLNDYHGHPHGVMILHGKAVLSLEDKQYELSPRDVVFIGPWEHHSFATMGDDPLGFLCVIPSKELMDRLEKLP